MKLTIKCPKCSHTFVVSERFRDKPTCKCGWQYKAENFYENCLSAEQESTDELELDPKYNSLESCAASCVITPYYIKTWLESRFATIPEKTIASFRQLMDNINFKKVSEFKNFISKFRLGVITVISKKIQVYIGKFENAYYDEDKNSINIPYGDTDGKGNLNITEISNQIQHEISHVIDKKLLSKTWKGPTDKYKELTKKPTLAFSDSEFTTYVKELSEFDAIGSHFYHNVKSNFQTSKEKQKIIDRLTNWLKNNDDNIMFLRPLTLKAWRTKPTLFRKFQQRVWNLIQELKELLKAEEKVQI